MEKLAPLTFIKSNTFDELSKFLKTKNYSSYFILCDENTLAHCLPTLITKCKLLTDAEIIEIESGEENKQLEIVANIWQTLIDFNTDKNSLLINLGGGVITDLGGFVASTFKRGIDFINIPTSLLAMADASVGGKNGIDFANIKNVVGTITQPKAIFIYASFLNTLPQRQYNNGLAEVYKIALVFHKKLWQGLSEKKETKIIETSVALKQKIVAKDMHDKGLRKILNFGHTLGHAIESFLLNTENPLLHGEAVVIGMLLESHIAFQKKMITKEIFIEIETVLCTHFNIEIKEKLGFENLKPIISNDKKNSSNKIRMALITDIGACTFDVEVTEKQIINALNYFEGNATKRN